MTDQTLANLVTKLEGGKSKARVGDVREIIRLVAELESKARVKAAFAQKGGAFEIYSIATGGPIMAIVSRADKIALKLYNAELKRLDKEQKAKAKLEAKNNRLR